jgi:hypothetical protein
MSVQTATKRSIRRRTKILVVDIKGNRGGRGTLLVVIKRRRRGA